MEPRETERERCRKGDIYGTKRETVRERERDQGKDRYRRERDGGVVIKGSKLKKQVWLRRREETQKESERKDRAEEIEIKRESDGKKKNIRGCLERIVSMVNVH